MLDFISKNFSFKNTDITVALYTNLIRPHLEYAVQFWSLHHAKDIAKIETVQGRAGKMITSLSNTPYEERPVRLNLLSLEKRRLQGEITECFRILKGLTNVERCSQLITHQALGATV